MASGHRQTEINGAMIGGAVAALGLFGGVILVGNVASFEALRLIRATIPAAHFLAAAAVGAGVTVLALMLTLIGLTNSSEWSFSELHYKRIRNITNLALAVIATGVVVLVAVAVPIEEVEELRDFYAVLYYSLTAMLSILGGLIVAMSLMIGSTIRALVEVALGGGKSHPLIEENSEDQESSQS